MNQESLTQFLTRALRQNDPAYFAPLSDHCDTEDRDHVLFLLRATAGEICASLPQLSALSATWKARSGIAPLAQRLRFAMEGFKEPEEIPRGNREAIQQHVLELILRDLGEAMTGPTPPALTSLAAVVIALEIRRLDSVADSANLMREVRWKLGRIGFLLQRASACLWTAAMHMQKESSEASAPAVITAKSRLAVKRATATDAAAYQLALKEFAEKVQALNVDPASLPVGEEAVGEGLALCEVRRFLEQRYLQMRSWVHPQACAESWASHVEYGADRGERLILSYWDGLPTRADATDPRAWTWQDQDKAEHIVGDLLTSLHQAADLLGIDWDAAEGLSAWHYEEEEKDASEVNEPAEA